MERSGFANFLLGLGVGVGIGMLFAPKAGGETRDMLRTKADEGKEYLRHRSSELRGSAEDLVEKGKEMLGRQRDNLSDAVEAGRQAYRDTVGQQQHQPPVEGSAH